jgi:apolipoprotein N-acyltransferase
MFSRFLCGLAALRGLRADLAALALGALAAAALPPAHVLPALLIAVPGLLALIDGADRVAVAARRGWWFGLGHHVFGLYWITEAILFEAARFWWLVPLAVPALAAALAVFIAIACGVARLAPAGWPRVLALSGAWVLMDLIRQFVLTGFPWNLWGGDWAIPGSIGDIFIQPAAWIGVHGLTLVTLLLAAVPKLSWRLRLGGLALFAAWATFGVVRLHETTPVATPLSVALLQGDISQGQKFDQDLAIRIFRHYLELSAQGRAFAGSGPLVAIWPETAFPGYLDYDSGARSVIEQATGGAPSLVGSIRFDEQRRPRNSLFALVDGGTTAGVYDKWHLVPFGEYIPDWLPLPIMVLPGNGLAPGPGPKTLRVPGLPPFGALICYEAIFSGQLVDRADRPAWLVNITNDAWFGNSSGPRQHLAAARMRAVEEGLPLVRAANTGISAIFDARGHELARLGMLETGVVQAKLPSPLPETLYAHVGLWIPAILGFAALAIGLSARRLTARS